MGVFLCVGELHLTILFVNLFLLSLFFFTFLQLAQLFSTAAASFVCCCFFLPAAACSAMLVAHLLHPASGEPVTKLKPTPKGAGPHAASL